MIVKESFNIISERRGQEPIEKNPVRGKMFLKEGGSDQEIKSEN
jgi:hypothetical protein